VGVIKGFSWLDPGRIAGMADPSGEGAGEVEQRLKALNGLGVGAVVSLTEVGLPEEAVRHVGLVYLHLPMPDMEAPSQESIRRFVRFVEECNARGIGVAVHCGAGLGRTGTMLAAYLVSRRHSAEDSIDRVRQIRPGSIETRSQEDAVRQYALDAQLQGSDRGED